MFLFLSKIADVLLEPVTWTILLVIASLVFRRRGALSVALALAGVAVLFLCSLGPIAARANRLVERGAKSTFDPRKTYDAVILLGGGLDPEATARARSPEFNEGSERFLRTFELLRSGRAKTVIISGGSIDPKPNVPVEADVLADQLERWGIDKSRIIRETKSRNTRENAVNTEAILHGRGERSLLLVTSAFHLPRAAGCFRRVGLQPDLLPVDFRAPGGTGLMQSLLPRARHLAATSDAIHELFGRLVYRLVGYST